MGLENFRERYSGPDFKAFLLREKERFPYMSNIAFLAMRFADFGAEGLKETEKDLVSKAKAYLVNISPPYPISQLDRVKLGDNYSSIVVGLGLQFMDKALFDGAFDKAGFVREHNKRIEGSVIYAPLFSDDWEALAINNDDLQKMWELANADKTLSVFFNEGFSLMPYFIQKHVENIENLDVIRRNVIPIYYPVAVSLPTSS